MIINNIVLTNIGPYKGFNTFDLQTKKGRNVILIGGENGAGKTTLLNAIKIGLFGAYSFGYKTENTEYFKQVESILNHQAKRDQELDFSIRIKFSIIDNYEKTDFDLSRKWQFSKGNLKETYHLIANNEFLNEEKKDLFNSKLKEVMPPQLLDFCLFDGEEIARIVSNDTLSDYIKNLSRVVFNLDLFETLEIDLDNYSKQNLDVAKMESIELEIYEANKRERELRDCISESIANLKESKGQLLLLNDEHGQLKNDFEKYGGLIKSQREEIIKQISTLEHERKQRNEEIRGFVTNLLPFYLMKDLLGETRTQIQDEESLQLFKQLNNKLEDGQLSVLANKLQSKDGQDPSETIKSFILDIMKPSREIEPIHGASFSESSLIENMFLTVNNDSLKVQLEKIEKNQEQLKSLSVLKSKLKTHDSTNEFNVILEQIEEKRVQIQILEDHINVQENLIQEWTKSLEETLEKIGKIQNTIKGRDKTVNSFLESQKIIALSRRFRDIQLQKKLQEVQIKATMMLKNIFRKQNYVSSIKINANNYEVTLIDAQNNTIEKRTLSAGEKQILLISIIWAIFESSKRQVPFIFDTLLGRLDKTHKAAVLKEFIPKSGKQAIILSTDSEIDESHYRILEENISKEYMLEFNPISQETKINKKYFSFK